MLLQLFVVFRPSLYELKIGTTGIRENAKYELPVYGPLFDHFQLAQPSSILIFRILLFCMHVFAEESGHTASSNVTFRHSGY